MDWLYLDNNATTQPAAQVVAAMNEINASLWANPSSVHRFGQMVRQRVELARASVARLLRCKDRELIFTSGGTESNNLALRGVFEATGKEPADARRVLITTKIEHAAVREPAMMFAGRGVEVVHLPVSIDGWVDPQDVKAAMTERIRPGDAAVVSVQWANNETGVIQPVEEIAREVVMFREAIRQREGAAQFTARTKVLLHVDATQAAGKLPIDLGATPLDLMTLSAHKFHGPKGVGALFVRSGLKLRPQNLGGPQERDRRGGTENTPGIIGMGVAAELAQAFVEDAAKVEAQRGLRDRLERLVREALPETVVNSGGRPRLWNTSNLGFPRLEAEAVLLGMSERGLCASAGAACSSGSLEPSPVLLAMGIAPVIAHGSVRLSLSRFTTQEEIDAAAAITVQVVTRLSRVLPVG